MFLDRVQIEVIAGNGGSGAISFRREKYVPNGGPDGGDGGKGGDIIFKAVSNKNTLQDFRYKKKFKADSGENGGKRKKYGKSGQDLVIEVPCGTVIFDANKNVLLADLIADGEEILIAAGGYGGKGNTHFKTSRRQSPRFARAGGLGESLILRLELKLIADLGLIGLPNSGKSSFLALVSNAKPKIANYPFTTTKPNLGIVASDEDSFVLADIPGLIEGAASGAGLGHYFLRHIERCKILLHLIDASSANKQSIIEAYELINQELRDYSPDLDERFQILALNKMDIADEERLAEAKAYFEAKGIDYHLISVASTEGVKELVQLIRKEIAQRPAPIIHQVDQKKFKEFIFEEEDLFTVSKSNEIYLVEGSWVEKIMASINFDDYDSFYYFQRLLRRRGVIDELKSQGLKEGDTVSIAGFDFEYIE